MSYVQLDVSSYKQSKIIAHSHFLSSETVKTQKPTVLRVPFSRCEEILISVFGSVCFKMAFNGDGPHSKRQRTATDTANNRVSKEILRIIICVFWTCKWRLCIDSTVVVLLKWYLLLSIKRVKSCLIQQTWWCLGG